MIENGSIRNAHVTLCRFLVIRIETKLYYCRSDRIFKLFFFRGFGIPNRIISDNHYVCEAH